MNANIVLRQNQPITEYDQFAMLLLMLEKTVSESSWRVYLDTYKKWDAWCIQNGYNPLNITAEQFQLFLDVYGGSKATNLRMKSAMIKVAELVLDIDDTPTRRIQMRIFKNMRVKATVEGTERQIRALTNEEIVRVMSVWRNDDLISLRNQALVTLMFATWIRRSEAAALEWRDIDFAGKTVAIRNGKGGKSRIVKMLGNFPIEPLKRWREAQGGDCRYVFTPIGRDGLVVDQPMLSNSIYKIIINTANNAKVEFTPHDIRHTGITDAYRSGSVERDIQEQAGHARASTTQAYAVPVKAQERHLYVRNSYEELLDS